MSKLARAVWGAVAVASLTLLAGCPAPPPAAGPAPKTEAKTPTDAAPAKTEEVKLGGGAGSKGLWGPEDGISLGSYMALTGGNATFGQSSNMAMGMAIEEINAAGGVLGGKKLKLSVEDTESKAESSVNAAERLLDTKGAVVLIGEVASSCSLAVAPMAQKKGIPMLTPSSTNPTVTEKGDFIFRSCFTDDQQGAYVVKFALSRGYRKGVIIKDIENDYSKGLEKVITELFPKGGGKILQSFGYTLKQPDFSPILTEAKGLEPDVIFVPGYYEQVGVIIKTARELGIKAAIVGADGWDSPVLARIAGASLDQDCYFVNHYSKDEDRPKVQDFVKNFKQRYSEDPDALAACAYDAIYIVKEAIERAKGTEPKALRDALAATKDFDGVTGRITIDKDRNASKPCVVLGFKEGKQVLVTSLKPSDL
jgi:branched-chain amino acid transport system substrate-binding protein